MKISLLIVLILSAHGQESLLGNLYAGYQGWFNNPEDGSGLGFGHYKMRDGPFARNNAVIDFWPEMA